MFVISSVLSMRLCITSARFIREFSVSFLVSVRGAGSPHIEVPANMAVVLPPPVDPNKWTPRLYSPVNGIRIVPKPPHTVNCCSSIPSRL